MVDVDSIRRKFFNGASLLTHFLEQQWLAKVYRVVQRHDQHALIICTHRFISARHMFLFAAGHHGFTRFLQLVPASSPCSLLGLFLAANLIALPRASFPEAAWVGNMHEKLVSACCGWSRQATGVGHLVGTLAFVAMTLFRWGSSLPVDLARCRRPGAPLVLALVCELDVFMRRIAKRRSYRLSAAWLHLVFLEQG